CQRHGNRPQLTF
nr:immunoglobulin light chain junction region [Macaca mulatta]